MTLAGDGMQFRNFVYVEDLAEGNVLALQSAAKNRTYNLDGTEKVTIRQIAETVAKVVGNVKIEYVPARLGDFSGKTVDSSRAKTELGWEPKTSFEEGLNKYINWYKKRESDRATAWGRLDDLIRNDKAN